MTWPEFAWLYNHRIEKWYFKHDKLWPEDFDRTSLTKAQAVLAARYLYWLAMARVYRGPIKVLSGRRHNHCRRASIRDGRVDFSGNDRYVICVNPARGWHEFVHTLGHSFHKMRYEEKMPGFHRAGLEERGRHMRRFAIHCHDHARLERMLIRAILASLALPPARRWRRR
jgi:hypothetical protein